MENREINSGNILALPAGYELHKRYRVGEVLGAGGFGITYKAFDTLNKAYCAIKEYVPLGLCVRASDGIELRPASQEQSEVYFHGKDRFMEEAAVLLEVSGIPNIVRLTDYFDGNGTAYYVMEYLEGKTLKQLQKVLPEKRIPFSEAWQILNVIGKALDKVHNQRFLLHRDISPDNIFYTRSGKLKLIDFGSAKHVCKQGNQNFSVVIKQSFAPPEQYKSTETQGPYTDVYALASTFYYMICGVRLPDALERVVGAEYTPAWQLVPEMTRQMSAVLDKALQTDYRRRYQTVEQFLWELAQAARDAGEEAEKEIVHRPCVIWRDGNVVQKCWLLTADVTYLVGRSDQKSQLVIPGHLEISKRHCQIQYDSQSNKFLVMDVSTNGVQQKGRRLQKDAVYAVDVGTRLLLAGICELELGMI